MKKLLLLILVFITFAGYSQKKKAIKYFDQGVIAFSIKDYKLADSLFTISANMDPHPDTYFNLAATKNKEDDFCGFCENMNKAAVYGAAGANELYEKNCVVKDSIVYKNVKSGYYNYYCIVSFHKCLQKNTYQFYEVDKENKNTRPFDIIITDSSKFSEQDFKSPDFDIESVPLANISYSLPELPQFPGGAYALDEFIYNDLKTLDKSFFPCNGIVHVSFNVEVDGSLSDIKLLKGMGRVCDDECLKIVKSMPKWIPGKKDGKAVKSRYMIRIAFYL